MTWSVEVTAEAVACVAPFISTDETRYYLNGVCIERAKTGVVIVATNGHCLGAYHDPDAKIEGEFDRPIFKVPPAIKDDLRTKWILVAFEEDDEVDYRPADSLVRRVRFHSDGRVTLIRGGKEATTAHGCMIDGGFPNWRKIVPAAVSTSPIPAAFAACYLGDFGSMSSCYGGRDHSGITVLPSGDEVTSAFVLTEDQNFLGLIMPKRWNRKFAEFAPADWLTERLGEPENSSPPPLPSNSERPK